MCNCYTAILFYSLVFKLTTTKTQSKKIKVQKDNSIEMECSRAEICQNYQEYIKRMKRKGKIDLINVADNKFLLRNQNY